MRADPDPGVRRRAHALLLVAEGLPVLQAVRLFHSSPSRIRTWRKRLLEEGPGGLQDAPRPGRPPKLGPKALTLLQEALTHSPTSFGFVGTVWTARDLSLLLARRLGLQVCAATVRRALRQLRFRYGRPRYDLTHRQDPWAVAAFRSKLEALKKEP